MFHYSPVRNITLQTLSVVGSVQWIARLGGQGWLPDARQTRRHAQAPQRKHSPTRETTRTTECCADARARRPTRVSGAVMRKLRRGASPGSACAWSCPNAGVKHLGESWARGVAVRWPSLTDALKPLRLADCQCDIPFSASQVQQIQT